HNHHYQVHRLAADLEAEAAAFDADEGRGAPAVRGLAARHTLAIGAAHDKTALKHRGDDRNAFRRAENFLGNALIRRAHDFVHHRTRFADPVHDLVFVAFRPAQA